ncbi:MAG TPA: hypothetical protein VFG22_13240 [Polyangiales bacterium]|nr:hypothetical protein [Polyangiales bacterium]
MARTISATAVANGISYRLVRDTDTAGANQYWFESLSTDMALGQKWSQLNTSSVSTAAGANALIPTGIPSAALAAIFEKLVAGR